MDVMHERQHAGLFGAIPSFLLGLIERLVGRANQIGRGRDPIGHRAREPEADRDGISVGLLDLRLANLSSQCVRNLGSAFDRRAGQDNDEFIASIAGHQVAGTVDVA